MGGAYHVLTWITAWPALGANLAEGIWSRRSRWRASCSIRRRNRHRLRSQKRWPARVPRPRRDRTTARERLLAAATLARDSGFL
jgi:hypothetical protein